MRKGRTTQIQIKTAVNTSKLKQSTVASLFVVELTENLFFIYILLTLIEIIIVILFITREHMRLIN